MRQFQHTQLPFAVLCSVLILYCESQLSADPEPALRLPADFHGERIYEVPNRQGSWVSMTCDPQGRLIVSDQYGLLYRVSVDREPVLVEPIPLKIGFAQGLLCAFDSLYVVAHRSQFDSVDDNGVKRKITNPSGLYRVRDTDDDDRYDSVELLREFKGEGEHGPHAIILGPDKQTLFVCAGNHTALPNPESTRVPKVWREDQLTPRLPDAGGHGVGIEAPGGWICKTDPDGKEFELIAIGFRNQYDIAFNDAGDLFTYDADMEWDIGLPWYRPTRICHVISGAEFGWRNGSGKWPTYFPDSLPPVLDIGPGSPTGITFGTSARFPARFQQALYVADWSYGIIYKIDLQKESEKYTATKSVFCTAPVLPVTDVVVNHFDGSMYFLTGGRKSQSALFRITYQGDQTTSPLSPTNDAAPSLLKQIESFHVELPDEQVDTVWAQLNSPERIIRYAARTAIELHWDDAWNDRSFTTMNVDGQLESLLAMIRMATDDSSQEMIFDALHRFDFAALTEMQKLHLLRSYGLAMLRLGKPTEDSLQHIHALSDYFPDPSDSVNRELARVLAAAHHEDVVKKSIAQMLDSDSQQQKIHYAMVLHAVKSGWTDELIEQYLQWFIDASDYAGGSSFRKYLANIRMRFAGELPPEKYSQFKALIDTPLEAEDPYVDLQARAFVRKWTLHELQNLSLEQADLENGKQIYTLAQCNKCHLIHSDGGIVGPDLTNAGRRFSTNDLLETIIDPNKEISDQYRATTFLLDDGRIITGRVANLVRNEYLVQEDMIRPGELTRIHADTIDDMRPSTQSMMPSGLLDTFSKEEIEDLIGYLKSVTASE